jgi:putative ubiquitin-RnfH superfamily antitoxin RatB of RatAB toxin-antitoxin module
MQRWRKVIMTGADPLLAVVVVYALPDRQRQVHLTLANGSTARQAVIASGLDKEFPSLNLSICPIGIFGKQAPDHHVLRTGDRVEIYRPLPNDPHELRRERARHAAVTGVSRRAG